MRAIHKTTHCAVIIGLLLCLTASADLNDGLSAYYKLDGNAIDETGNHDGVVTGMGWVPGVVGSAASFNGTSDYITMGITSDLLNSPQVSFSFWVNFDDLSAAGMFVSSDGGSLDNEFHIRMETINIGRLSIQYGTGGTLGHARSFALPFSSTDVWYHVVVIMDNTQDNSENRSQLYVNGAELTDSTLLQTNAVQNTPIGNNSTPFRMAYFANPSSKYWPGQLDEIRIYNRVLTESEIRQLAGIEPTALSEGYHVFDVKIAAQLLGSKGDDTTIDKEKIQGLLVYNGDNDAGQFVYTKQGKPVALDTDFSYAEYINAVKENKSVSITDGVASAQIGIDGFISAVALGSFRYMENPASSKITISLVGAGTDDEAYGSLMLRYNQKQSDALNSAEDADAALQEMINAMKGKAKKSKSKKR